MKKAFEKELPQGYTLKKHIDAKNARLGIILNAICIAVMVVVVLLAYVIGDALGDFKGDMFYGLEPLQRILPLFITLIAMLVYLVLHELVHGIAYKGLTGQRLTFGISWSCAFCGMPDIYTYRRTTLISVSAPLVVFSIVFLGAMIGLYFVHPLYYMLGAVLLGMHLGGCSGDVYVIYLLLCKFKDKKTLVRDTGPEQFFYVPEENTVSEIEEEC